MTKRIDLDSIKKQILDEANLILLGTDACESRYMAKLIKRYFKLEEKRKKEKEKILVDVVVYDFIFNFRSRK